MANWEFLLQKKGDRQWGTAHKTALKLKADSYRIAAQGRPNADVHIEIIFETQDAEGKSVRRSQNRMKSTNERGLIAIMPFTPLKPGMWEIICRSLDVATPWESRLRLKVLPVAQPKPQIFRPLPLPPNPNLFSFEASLTPSESGQTKAIDPEGNVLDRSLAKLMAARTDGNTSESLREMVERTLHDLEPIAEEDQEEEADDWTVVDETASDLLQGSLMELEELLKEELEPIWQEMEQSAQQTAAAPIMLPVVAVALSQPVYTWQADQPIEIQGTLRAIAAIPEAYQDRWQQSRLCFTLRNPQNSDKLVFVEQDITALTLPHSFRQAFSIDPQCQTLAIVGEITLELDGTPLVTLATQNFTLIADYQAIAAQVKLPEVPPEDEALGTEKPFELDLPSPTAIAIETSTFEPRQSSILPPKLGKQPKSHNAPKLPSFMQAAENSPTNADGVDDELMPETTTPPSLLGGDAPVVMSARTAATPSNSDNIPYPFVFEPETEITEAVILPDAVTEAIATPSTPDPEPEPTTPPPDLDWNSRFFSRLNALVADGTDSSWLEEQPEPEEVLIEPEVRATLLAELGLTESADGKLRTAEIVVDEVPSKPKRMEIVVDDLLDEADATDQPEPVQPKYDASGLLYPQELFEPDEPIATEGLQPSLGALPEPILSLSKPEYQAAEMAVVRVIVPPYGDRLYVKLWMQDRQTRGILAGPHQLTDFTVDREGNRETLIQIAIPQGTLEVRFEAIAINPRLQQESRKVGIDRRVVPQDFSAINWDDLDV